MFLHHSIARVRVVSLTKRAPREGEVAGATRICLGLNGTMSEERGSIYRFLEGV